MVASTNVFMAGLELLFFFNDTATTEIYTLSLHDALPILTVPPELEVKVTVHWPLALVPVEAQVSVMFVAVAPLVLARVTVGFTALTGCGPRSEERRVGKVCRSRWSAYHSKKKEGPIAMVASIDVLQA